ncbi:thiol:disulfide interchange protein DsbA/DsbL [Pelomonas sp. SE-A7]|uniref:thiol:disulfide interchange protein DsbA/DsbL n=1 Tax=Pelomonas sp. SE-A7 TaxID=3054953 RepID=UPI00259CA46C|nr:thiol:disulfide interchange protein DsbA/DsbL [Pelomonas sp. SE-A7]MDM4766992.1 thiol:disulfide interchange protein DsbA/DsbL [Pelomonas sp. SE-A7]
MKRRDFSALGLAALAGSSAWAQGGPVEGKHYKRLGNPVPTTPGKIEVIEFFWYGCPHCYALEPMLREWVKQLPADVAFRRIHVGFRPNIKPHQKLFLTLEALGKSEELQGRVFEAFHRERVDVEEDKDMLALAVRLGVDQAKFAAMYNSFAINGKMATSNKLSEAYNIDGVPALGIAGRFWTSPSMVGAAGMSEQDMGMRALQVTNALIQGVRNGKL